jgi:4-hydroxy-3-methylbut-2-enyl diphosphate reductase
MPRGKTREGLIEVLAAGFPEIGCQTIPSAPARQGPTWAPFQPFNIVSGTKMTGMCDEIRPQARLLPLTIYVAAPRGFCAGVDRAIQIVELALAKYGAPVYVRHEIVHNRHVVEALKAKGAIFVEELDEIPDTQAPVIFSAHGVPKSVPEAAEARNLFYLDATCPLVSKVHIEAERHHEAGREVLLIGHAGHPEVLGTMGQLPEGSVHLIETIDDALAFIPKDADALAYTTQTTLSVDDTRAIAEVLKGRFPRMVGPHKDDICYATTNRQEAVKRIAPLCDRLIVVGSPNSSNSLRLVEVAGRVGCPRAMLVQSAAEIDWANFVGIESLGITAGASAPEVLVEEIIEAFKARFAAKVQSVVTAEEDIAFKLPRQLRDGPAL